MRAFIAIAFALCIISAQAVSSSSFRESREHEVAQKLRKIQSDSFGKKLLKTISIELQTSDRVDDVVDVINGLSDELTRQQAVDDADYSDLSGRYQQTIQDQDDGIAASTNNIQDLTNDRAQNVQILNGLNADRDNLLNEADTLNNFLDTLGASRNNEADSYAQRTADQEAIVQGLEAVIQLLSQDANNDDGNFDVNALADVIGKLNEVLDGVIQSLTSDDNAENAAIANYNDFVAKANNRLGEIADAVADLDEQIAATQAQIDADEAAIDLEESKIENYIIVKNENINLLQTLNQNYQNNAATRADQQNLISQLVSILQTRLNAVRTYLPDVIETTA